MKKVKKRNGRLEDLNLDKINLCAEMACEDLDSVSVSEIVLDASLQIYDKIPTKEIDKALIMSSRSKIEKEPNYAYVSARLLLHNLYKEVFGEGFTTEDFEEKYKKHFVGNIKKLVKQERLTKELLSYDLNVLAEAITPKRDELFKYLGIQTLYDRYFIHLKGRRMETPQSFYMRVAMGLCLNEENKEQKAIEIYNMMSEFRYSPSTPTLFNSGTKRSQLSSCYLSTVHDSIDGIFGTIHGQARLSKYAGGLGIDWSYIRATGSYIQGTNGNSSGLVPWLKIFNDTLVAVNQGGKRKGAGCAYLEVWHLDVEDFLELRKNTGDDRRRCHDMNTALWICDEFMLAVKEERDWYLFDPHECPDLHDLYGEEFTNVYAQYCEMAENGELENFIKMPAKDLWKKCLKALFETGHPWITFKDPSNIRYSNKHAGVVHSSNLCTEILLHTKPSVYDEGELTEVGETAVCNLASINLANHVKVRTIDWKKLQKTVEVAVRGLDNVIELNFYPTEEARNSNLKNRPVGLGVMGTHDVLHKLNINYDSQEAIDLCGKIQEFISLHAIKTSALLAKEKGSYPTFGGSEWDKGNFPIDTYCELRNQRITKPCVEEDASLYETLEEWGSVRQLVADYGMRNSNVMAIAPTATISYIQGCSQSIEPDYSTLYVYSTLSGEFTMVNEHFVALAKKNNIWSQELIDALKSVDGDVTALVDLSDEIKQEFKNAFDVSYETLIKAAAARQRWIDMGQSLNLYNKYESLKYLNDMYMLAWEECLKTTYYLRSKAATRLEKSTVSESQNNEDSGIINEVKACSILDPGCESCQ
jgi:ribonucleoside-diphosphate reductase alpha chain|tara:strand:+ start:11669 stop:14110 length:2442 start_codon:yes stop_codon:yes gene_type:complete